MLRGGPKTWDMSQSCVWMLPPAPTLRVTILMNRSVNLYNFKPSILLSKHEFFSIWWKISRVGTVRYASTIIFHCFLSEHFHCCRVAVKRFGPQLWKHAHRKPWNEIVFGYNKVTTLLMHHHRITMRKHSLSVYPWATLPLWLCSGCVLAEWGLCCTNQQIVLTHN